MNDDARAFAESYAISKLNAMRVKPLAYELARMVLDCQEPEIPGQLELRKHWFVSKDQWQAIIAKAREILK